MFSTTFTPRFSETDAFGHVNNTVLNIWFEAARMPIFSIFQGDDKTEIAFNLILARTEVDFVAQIYWGIDVEVKTYIEHIGNASFVVAHEAYQEGKLVAKGKAVQVFFNHETQRSQPLTGDLRQQLEALIPA